MHDDPTHFLTICIADIPVQLQLDCGDAARAKITEHYAAFATSETPRAFSVRLRQEPGDPYIPVNSSNVWQIRTTARNGHIEFESYFEKGWADRARGVGELALRSQGDPENFLRVLYTWLVLEQSGLLLHAAGVISRGQGYVFFGPSGSGKTTTARLSLDKTVLSDDLVIIKKHAASGKFWLYGVPFRGDLVEAPRVNAEAELRGVFALVKDSEHRVEPLAPPEALARISACVPFVMAQPQNSQRVMSIAAELAVSVPVRALHFRRDPGFWKVIDGLA